MELTKGSMECALSYDYRHKVSNKLERKILKFIKFDGSQSQCRVSQSSQSPDSQVHLSQVLHYKKAINQR